MRFTALATFVATATLTQLADLSGANSDALAVHYHDRTGNYCVGGEQDRKIIPHDHIRRPWKETSLLGCEAEGGRAVFMPDLVPAVKDGILV